MIGSNFSDGAWGAVRNWTTCCSRLCTRHGAVPGGNGRLREAENELQKDGADIAGLSSCGEIVARVDSRFKRGVRNVGRAQVWLFGQFVGSDATVGNIMELDALEVVDVKDCIAKCITQFGGLVKCCAVAVRDLAIDEGGEFREFESGAVGVNGVETIIERVGLLDFGGGDVRERKKRELDLLRRTAK